MQRLKENTEEKLKAIAEHKLQIAGNMEALNGSLNSLLEEEQDLKLILHLIEKQEKDLKEGGYIKTSLIDTSKIHISQYDDVKAQLAGTAKNNFKLHADITPTNTMEFAEGVQAAATNPYSQNPYMEGSQENMDWVNGFLSNRDGR